MEHQQWQKRTHNRSKTPYGVRSFVGHSFLPLYVNFAILLADIERPDATDRMGTRIRMQVYIGGLSETDARCIAVAALESWDTLEPLRTAVSKSDSSREWDVDFAAAASIVDSIIRSKTVNSDASGFSNRLSGNYSKDRAALVQELQNHYLSVSPGPKIYWGGIPSKDGESLRYKVDRYYCTNTEQGVLADRPKPATEKQKQESDSKPIPTPKPPSPTRPPLEIPANLFEQCVEWTKQVAGKIPKNWSRRKIDTAAAIFLLGILLLLCGLMIPANSIQKKPPATKQVPIQIPVQIPAEQPEPVEQMESILIQIPAGQTEPIPNRESMEELVKPEHSSTFQTNENRIP